MLGRVWNSDKMALSGCLWRKHGKHALLASPFPIWVVHYLFFLHFLAIEPAARLRAASSASSWPPVILSPTLRKGIESPEVAIGPHNIRFASSRGRGESAPFRSAIDDQFV